MTMECDAIHACNYKPYADVCISMQSKGCRSEGDTSTHINNKDVRSLGEKRISDECQQVRYKPAWLCYPKDRSEICLCCRERDQYSNERNVEKAVLYYELPEPKFDDMTIHRRDFYPKPLPNRELPPWHPIRKDRWKPLNVPSLNKSIYQGDYTPPIRSHHDKDVKQSSSVTLSERKEYRIPKKELESYSPHQESPESLQIWRKTSKEPGETIEVCDKPLLQIQETKVSTRCADPDYDKHLTEASKYREELHDPACEKHCYSTPLMCHAKPAIESTEPPTEKEVAAALTIEKQHLHHGKKKVHFAPEVCHIEPLPHEYSLSQGDFHKSNNGKCNFAQRNNAYIEQSENESMPYRRCNDACKGHSNNDGTECSRISSKLCFHENEITGNNSVPICYQSNHDDSHCFSEFPPYPGKSPAVHSETNSPYIPNSGPENSAKYNTNHAGLNYPGTNMCLVEPQRPYLEYNTQPPENAINFSSYDSKPHYVDGKKNLDYGPYGSGNYDDERKDKTNTNAYSQTSSGDNFKEKSHTQDCNVICSRNKHLCISDNGGHYPNNSQASDSFCCCSNDKLIRNPAENKEISKFTLCEDTKPSNSKWWKAGGCDSDVKFFATEDVPSGVIKPCCPSYITLTSKDFKHPGIYE